MRAWLLAAVMLGGCTSSADSSVSQVRAASCVRESRCDQCVAAQCPDEWNAYCSGAEADAFEKCIDGCDCFNACFWKKIACVARCTTTDCCSACETDQEKCKDQCPPEDSAVLGPCKNNCHTTYPSASQQSSAIWGCRSKDMQRCTDSCVTDKQCAAR
jgi:hypothetical protein